MPRQLAFSPALELLAPELSEAQLELLELQVHKNPFSESSFVKDALEDREETEKRRQSGATERRFSCLSPQLRQIMGLVEFHQPAVDVKALLPKILGLESQVSKLQARSKDLAWKKDVCTWLQPKPSLFLLISTALRI